MLRKSNSSIRYSAIASNLFNLSSSCLSDHVPLFKKSLYIFLPFSLLYVCCNFSFNLFLKLEYAGTITVFSCSTSPSERKAILLLLLFLIVASPNFELAYVHVLSLSTATILFISIPNSD